MHTAKADHILQIIGHAELTARVHAAEMQLHARFAELSRAEAAAFWRGLDDRHKRLIVSGRLATREIYAESAIVEMIAELDRRYAPAATEE
jgi:hypothetical protein